MDNKLQGKRVAFLAADGVDQAELIEPFNAIKNAGAKTELISIKEGSIQGVKGMDKGDKFPVDKTVKQANADEYDALVIPGGVANPDKLRLDKDAVAFVRRFFDTNKPIGAICHGPWMLVEADVVKGRTITSWPSLRTDVRNAGGKWVDEEVRVEQGIVTSRKPDDIPAFNRKLIEEIAEGKHTMRMPAAEAERVSTTAM
ncbi:MAG: type 1 glutamine amidotransferase domain-containing protein [Thermomicrobiales bacterium]